MSPSTPGSKNKPSKRGLHGVLFITSGVRTSNPATKLPGSHAASAGVADSSKKLVTFYQTTRCHVQEDNLQSNNQFTNYSLYKEFQTKTKDYIHFGEASYETACITTYFELITLSETYYKVQLSF
jgi:hypothetical protein